MRKLQKKELMSVSGANPLMVGVGIGIATSYIYESIGSKAGIDNYFANGWASMSASTRLWTRRLQRHLR